LLAAGLLIDRIGFTATVSVYRVVGSMLKRPQRHPPAQRDQGGVARRRKRRRRRRAYDCARRFS
jgi:hypothetical protein